MFGRLGHPVRTTVSEMGPLLFSRLLELNDTQAGVLDILFAAADDQGLALLDIDDLQAMLRFASDNRKDLEREYGAVSPASVSAIQRKLMVLDRSGAGGFFGEPALEVSELLKTDRYGKGFIHILEANELSQSPRLYGTVLLWLLAELFEDLPEAGDVAGAPVAALTPRYAMERNPGRQLLSSAPCKVSASGPSFCCR